MDCRIEDCSRLVKARGVCQQHYLAERTEQNLAAGRLCSFDGCQRPTHLSLSLCRSHARQLNESGKSALQPLRVAPAKPEDDGPLRRCRGCGEWKERSAFPLNRTQCARCSRVHAMYGLTSADFARVLAKQDGKCAICGATEPGGRWGSWHVDHDHACCPGIGSCGRCVCGLLCNNCNMGLGFFRDDPAALDLAAAYLRRVRPQAES